VIVESRKGLRPNHFFMEFTVARQLRAAFEFSTHFGFTAIGGTMAHIESGALERRVCGASNVNDTTKKTKSEYLLTHTRYQRSETPRSVRFSDGAILLSLDRFLRSLRDAGLGTR